MDNQDQRNAVNSLVGILRKATRIVQLTPFVFLLFVAVYLIAEPVLPCLATRLGDIIFGIPFAGVAGMLVTGRLFRLCAWFRTACLLPMVTKVEAWIDSFIVTFTQVEAAAINILTGMLLLAFLVASFKHFFAHGK